MWKCPVCDQENNAATVCPTCGYDRTCDYEQYPTAFAVTTATPTRTLRRAWQEKQNPPVNGRNRKRTVTVTQEQAAQGCRITAGYVDGQRLELTVPAGTKDGSVLRCRGLGQPGRNGGKNGDLLITVRVQEPEAPKPVIDWETVSITPKQAARGYVKKVSLTKKKSSERKVGKDDKVSLKLPIPAGVVHGEKLHYPQVRADDGTLFDLTIEVKVGASGALPLLLCLLCLWGGIFGYFLSASWLIILSLSILSGVFIKIYADGDARRDSRNKKKYGPKTPEEKERCQTPREMPPQR
ncbi:MAG: DnaJ C-terminal domain-containing protein [Oscillospiraceae bacterium]